jgi:hypothetical protein
VRHIESENGMKVLIVFYTKEPQPPELFYIGNDEDFQKLMERVVELARNRSKFTISNVGKCIGDFS